MPITPSGWWRRVRAKAIVGHDRISGWCHAVISPHLSGLMVEEDGGNALRKRHWVSTMVMAGTWLPYRFGQQPAEQQVMDLANADRAQQGLPPLKWDPALAQAAAQHAQLMAQQPQLSHQYPGEPDLEARAGAAGAHFRAIAENVALAPSPRRWIRSGCTRLPIGLTSSIRVWTRLAWVW